MNDLKVKENTKRYKPRAMFNKGHQNACIQLHPNLYATSKNTADSSLFVVLMFKLYKLYGSGSKPKVPFFGDGYPPKGVYFKGFWDVHRGTGVLTHCHIIHLQFIDCIWVRLKHGPHAAPLHLLVYVAEWM